MHLGPPHAPNPPPITQHVRCWMFATSHAACPPLASLCEVWVSCVPSPNSHATVTPSMDEGHPSMGVLRNPGMYMYD